MTDDDLRLLEDDIGKMSGSHPVTISEPKEYDAKSVLRTRKRLNASQAVFAKMIGVSQVLVRSWERGVRTPLLLARRLLDQVRANPEQFKGLVHVTRVSPTSHRRSNRPKAA